MDNKLAKQNLHNRITRCFFFSKFDPRSWLDHDMTTRLAIGHDKVTAQGHDTVTAAAHCQLINRVCHDTMAQQGW